MSIRLSYGMWPRYERRLREVVGAMTDEQLAIRPSPGRWPVWATVGHTAGTRVYWLCTVLGEAGAEAAPFAGDDEGWEDDLDHPRGAAELVMALETTFPIIERCLDCWTPGWEASDVGPGVLGQGSIAGRDGWGPLEGVGAVTADLAARIDRFARSRPGTGTGHVILHSPEPWSLGGRADGQRPTPAADPYLHPTHTCANDSRGSVRPDLAATGSAGATVGQAGERGAARIGLHRAGAAGRIELGVGRALPGLALEQVWPRVAPCRAPAEAPAEPWPVVAQPHGEWADAFGHRSELGKTSRPAPRQPGVWRAANRGR